MLWILMTVALDTTHAVRIPVAPGESLQVVSAGAGEPVVLIPGLIGSAYTYRHVMHDLARRGYRALAIEPLGLGGSSKPKDADYSLVAQADRIGMALDSLGIDSAIVVGHSVGGSIAFRLAYRHPRRVRAVISLEGAPTQTAAGASLKRAMALAPLLKLLNGTKIVRGHMRRELRNASIDSSWVTETVLDGYSAGAVAEYHATIDAFKGIANAVEPERLADRLPEIQAPVVLVVGREPHASGPSLEEIAVLAERLASFRVDSVAGTGHFVQEERPDAVVQAVLRLAQPARGAGVP